MAKLVRNLFTEIVLKSGRVPATHITKSYE